MSLQELLKNADEFSPWYKQRRRLFRVVGGLAIATGSIALGALLLYHSARGTRKPAATAIQTEATNAAALADLIKIKNQADALGSDLRQARHPRRRPQDIGHRRKVDGGEDSSEIISYDPGEGFNNLQGARKNFYIPTGAVFQAQLLTPIKTSVDKSFVMAEVTHEFRMDFNRRILRGSRLIGHARLNPVLKGVVVEFEKLVTPAGVETGISSLAMSRNALPEIEGLFFSDKLTSYGTALAFGFLSGFADASRTRDITLLTSQPDVSVNNSVLTGFSTASFQIADEMMRDIRAHSVEYVVVPAGERIFVALTQKYEMNQGITNDAKAINF